jgi:hypothetical protein
MVELYRFMEANTRNSLNKPLRKNVVNIVVFTHIYRNVYLKYK